MRIRAILAALAAASLHATSAKPFDNLDRQIDKQHKIAFQGVLNNIGPNGKKAPGASAGVIIASPSTQDPDYFFTWTRDAALTMKMIVDEFLQGKRELRSLIQNYLKSQAILQTVSNPSGALSSGRGLGEPKYYSNLTRFNGDWGRPQRDGPALRATALITYARWLLSTGRSQDAQEAKDKVWPVVRNDLEYVAQYWNTTGFDLWEEVLGTSFFTTAAQHRALVEGAALGKQLGQQTSTYDAHAPHILCFLQTYWNGEYAVANTNTQKGFSRTGIDANTVLTSVVSFDPEAKCDDTTFQPCSPRALANLKAYADSFRPVYTINKGIPTSSGVATGRYTEDVYYGGHPWYLTTLAVAEQLYAAIQQWSTHNSLTITSVDLPFWKAIYPKAKPGTLRKGRDFNKHLDAVLTFADSFVKVALKYTPSNGALSEQYSRENGTQVSARDLTWSYAAFVTMRSARLAATSEHPQVPSWGAPAGPASCPSAPPDFTRGTYIPATAAGAPPGAGGCTILTTFNVNASTFFGENLYMLGNVTELGNWRVSDALPGTAFEYSEERPLWKFEVELPETVRVEYGYVRKRPAGSEGGEVVFESRNRTLTVEACEQGVFGEMAVEDEWVGEV